MADDDVGVPLADFVAGLRSELKSAAVDADPDLPIEVGPVTVEFTVLTRQEAEANAGVKFWVVDAGASARRGSESTQRVTIELQPLRPGGGRARIHDSDCD